MSFEFCSFNPTPLTIMKKLLSFLSKKKPAPAPLFDIVFYSDKPDYGTHGYIHAECVQRGIHKPTDVRFCFVGMSKPPVLTIDIITLLFNEAANQGFVVHSLKTYGLAVRRQQPTNMGSVISDSRRMAESGAHKRAEVYHQITQPEPAVAPPVPAPAEVAGKQTISDSLVGMASFWARPNSHRESPNAELKKDNQHAPVHAV